VELTDSLLLWSAEENTRPRYFLSSGQQEYLQQEGLNIYYTQLKAVSARTRDNAHRT
jgi:hypothetical protein